MKKIFLFMIAVFAVVATANAQKVDYKNPVKIDSIGTIEITLTKTVERNCYLWTDKNNNRCFTLNVNFFVKKGKDIVNITLINDKTISVKPYKTYTIDTGQLLGYVGWYGNKSVYYKDGYKPKFADAKQKVTYKEFYTVYPITEDDYNDMLNIGIKEIRVDGVKIQYNPMK